MKRGPDPLTFGTADEPASSASCTESWWVNVKRDEWGQVCDREWQRMRWTKHGLLISDGTYAPQVSPSKTRRHARAVGENARMGDEA